MDLIPAKLDKVILADQRDSQTVIIAERDGKRFFPIEIGVFEAAALARRLQSTAAFSRPLTHDLTVNCISALGGTLVAIQIIRLENSTFFAELVIETSDGETRVDCRPSDALVLASEEHCDFYVADAVFDELTASHQ